MKRALFALLAAGTVAFGGAVAAPAASAPSFASEQLVGSLTDDNWEPTVAADPHAPWVYQAVTAINDLSVFAGGASATGGKAVFTLAWPGPADGRAGGLREATTSNESRPEKSR